MKRTKTYFCLCVNKQKKINTKYEICFKQNNFKKIKSQTKYDDKKKKKIEKHLVLSLNCMCVRACARAHVCVKQYSNEHSNIVQSSLASIDIFL